ncbi:DMP19 family protein [Winogradskyella sp.]|uniref:DMP19 family protein n=1 Tax=Winogradskyella sp. TaxID=1883156 RepID=UPI003F6D4904
MTEIDFALDQTKPTDIIELVGTVVWNKANANQTFQNLSEAERNFVFIDIFESEINNEGLYGFFYNTSGAFAHEVLQAYMAINASETADIVDKALRRFTELPVPKDIILRRQLMEKLQLEDLEAWSNLELDLVNSKENIVDLTIAYITLHKTEFEY